MINELYYKGDIALKKNNIRALLVATTLVVPFAVYPSAAQAAVTIEANKTEALAPDRIYDAEIKYIKIKKMNHLWFLNT